MHFIPAGERNPTHVTNVNTPNLSALKLAELQALAASLGISGASKLRKGELVNAINENGGAASTPDAPSDTTPTEAPVEAEQPSAATSGAEPVAVRKRTSRRVTSADTAAIAAAPELAGAPVVDAGASAAAPEPAEAPIVELPARTRAPRRASSANLATTDLGIELPEGPTGHTPPADQDGSDTDGEQGEGGQGRSRNRNRNRNERNGDRNDRNGERSERNGDRQQSDRQQGEQRQNGNRQNGQQQRVEPLDSDQGERSGRNRYRDRKRGRGGALGDDFEPEISEDDVLIPVAGILDVLDNYAFVRTTGYLPGNNDVYVSLGQVKKYNLRKGDAVVGAIRQPREGDNQQGRQK